MSYIEFLDKYSFVFSFAYTVIAGVIGLLVGKLLPNIKKYQIRKCLSLKKCECRIVLPQYVKNLHSKNDLVQVCPIGDIKAALNIIDLIYATGLYSHPQSIIYENEYSNLFGNYNIFCIGGSLANQYSYDLFSFFFPKFKIYSSEERKRYNPNKIPLDNFVFSETEIGFCWGDSDDEKFTINADERYAIIVKLSSKDFDIIGHGTVHILFGNGIEGTLAISKYLLNNYKDLYKRVKNKDHYFLAFKLKRNTGTIDPKKFIDLTDKMFK